MPARFEIHVDGLKELTKAGKAIDRGFGKALRQAHLKIAKLVETRTHASMKSGGRQAASATKGVRARATQKLAAIETGPGPGWTLGVIWGQKRRSGWFAARRYRSTTGRQFPDWAGNQWTPGATGGKPYHLGPAMNASLDEAVDILADEIETLARHAGF